MHAFWMHKILQICWAQIINNDLWEEKKGIDRYVVRVSGMAENRAFCVIIAQFHSEIKSPFSVTLTVKSPHIISLVSKFPLVA